MMDKTYLDRSQRLAELRDGRQLSNDELTGGFALYSPAKRVEILEAIDRDLGEGVNLRKMARELHTRRMLGDMHVTLRRAGR